MAQVAEEAQMTRTTVYRYFPNQKRCWSSSPSASMSTRASRSCSPRPLEDGITPQTRVVEILDELNRYVAANERVSRTAQRHYLDTWLAAERAGERDRHHQRERRRLSWISATLEPLRETMSDADRRRLEAPSALSPASKRLRSCATSVGSTPTTPSPSPIGPPRRFWPPDSRSERA